jgi:hypothetical protein
MPDSEPQTVILAVPGTQETQELDFQSVRDAVARGEIGLDHWAWCPAQNEWLPLGQLPGFAAMNPGIAEEPATEDDSLPEPTPAAVTSQGFGGPVIGNPSQLPATYYSRPIEDSREFPIFKTFFFILALVVAAMVGVNYYLIDQPYHQNLGRTPFASITTHAHLGAFVQPSALLIHILPSTEITSDNFADLLTTLTQCAPSEALKGMPFTSVALTSSWLGEYVISAGDWKGFADMAGLSADQKREYVLNHLEKNDGSPLVTYLKKDTPDDRKAHEAKAWNDLVAHFQPKS